MNVLDTSRCRSKFNVLRQNDESVTLEDCDDGAMSVTNDAENVVEAMVPLLNGRRLFYIDSMGDLGELCISNGIFAGFGMGDELVSNGIFPSRR